jgi:hypothetical protein
MNNSYQLSRGLFFDSLIGTTDDFTITVLQTKTSVIIGIIFFKIYCIVK